MIFGFLVIGIILLIVRSSVLILENEEDPNILAITVSSLSVIASAAFFLYHRKEFELDFIVMFLGFLACMNMVINAWQCLSVGEIKMKKEVPKKIEIIG
jgi:hypothetical protein